MVLNRSCLLLALLSKSFPPTVQVFSNIWRYSKAHNHKSPYHDDPLLLDVHEVYL
ncbi:hypothetical protein Hdeb2414_s0013g00420541 [Helianthus debilis subsp. tardiflorus]